MANGDYTRIQQLEAEIFEQANAEANFRLELRLGPSKELRQILVSQIMAASKRIELAKRQMRELEQQIDASEFLETIQNRIEIPEPRRPEYIPVNPRPLVSMSLV